MANAFERLGALPAEPAAKADAAAQPKAATGNAFERLGVAPVAKPEDIAFGANPLGLLENKERGDSEGLWDYAKRRASESTVGRWFSGDTEESKRVKALEKQVDDKVAELEKQGFGGREAKIAALDQLGLILSNEEIGRLEQVDPEAAKRARQARTGTLENIADSTGNMIMSLIGLYPAIVSGGFHFGRDMGTAFTKEYYLKKLYPELAKGYDTALDEGTKSAREVGKNILEGTAESMIRTATSPIDALREDWTTAVSDALVVPSAGATAIAGASKAAKAAGAANAAAKLQKAANTARKVASYDPYERTLKGAVGAARKVAQRSGPLTRSAIEHLVSKDAVVDPAVERAKEFAAGEAELRAAEHAENLGELKTGGRPIEEVGPPIHEAMSGGPEGGAYVRAKMKEQGFRKDIEEAAVGKPNEDMVGHFEDELTDIFDSAAKEAESTHATPEALTRSLKSNLRAVNQAATREVKRIAREAKSETGKIEREIESATRRPPPIGTPEPPAVGPLKPRQALEMDLAAEKAQLDSEIAAVRGRLEEAMSNLSADVPGATKKRASIHRAAKAEIAKINRRSGARVRLLKAKAKKKIERVYRDYPIDEIEPEARMAFEDEVFDVRDKGIADTRAAAGRQVSDVASRRSQMLDAARVGSVEVPGAQRELRAAAAKEIARLGRTAAQQTRDILANESGRLRSVGKEVTRSKRAAAKQRIDEVLARKKEAKKMLVEQHRAALEDNKARRAAAKAERAAFKESLPVAARTAAQKAAQQAINEGTDIATARTQLTGRRNKPGNAPQEVMARIEPTMPLIRTVDGVDMRRMKGEDLAKVEPSRIRTTATEAASDVVRENLPLIEKIDQKNAELLRQGLTAPAGNGKTIISAEEAAPYAGVYATDEYTGRPTKQARARMATQTVREGGREGFLKAKYKTFWSIADKVMRGLEKNPVTTSILHTMKATRTVAMANLFDQIAKQDGIPAAEMEEIGRMYGFDVPEGNHGPAHVKYQGKWYSRDATMDSEGYYRMGRLGDVWVPSDIFSSMQRTVETLGQVERIVQRMRSIFSVSKVLLGHVALTYQYIQNMALNPLHMGKPLAAKMARSILKRAASPKLDNGKRAVISTGLASDASSLFGSEAERVRAIDESSILERGTAAVERFLTEARPLKWVVNKWRLVDFAGKILTAEVWASKKADELGISSDEVLARVPDDVKLKTELAEEIDRYFYRYKGVPKFIEIMDRALVVPFARYGAAAFNGAMSLPSRTGTAGRLALAVQSERRSRITPEERRAEDETAKESTFGRNISVDQFTRAFGYDPEGVWVLDLSRLTPFVGSPTEALHVMPGGYLGVGSGGEYTTTPQVAPSGWLGEAIVLGLGRDEFGRRLQDVPQGMLGHYVMQAADTIGKELGGDPGVMSDAEIGLSRGAASVIRLAKYMSPTTLVQIENIMGPAVRAALADDSELTDKAKSKVFLVEFARLLGLKLRRGEEDSLADVYDFKSAIDEAKKAGRARARGAMTDDEYDLEVENAIREIERANEIRDRLNK